MTGVFNADFYRFLIYNPIHQIVKESAKSTYLYIFGASG